MTPMTKDDILLYLLGGFEKATGCPFQSRGIPQRRCGAVKVGGSRERTGRIRGIA